MESETPNENIRNYRVLILGPESTGKTAILYRLKLNEVISSVPTIGFNVESFVHNNNKYNLWDIGGSHKMRCLWANFYEDTNAIIFVIDSNNETQFEDAKNCLDTILSVNSLKSIPILFFANKTDLTNISISQLTEFFNLNAIKNRKWSVQLCSAKNGKGLEEGLTWLDKTMEKLNKKILQAHDIKENPKPIDESDLKKQDLPCMRILLLGIQNVGKTVLLFKLKNNRINSTINTIGFNVETINYPKANYAIWDVGGLPRVRVLWKHYFKDVNGIIFVVDSSNNIDRNEEKYELDNILTNEILTGLPVLIFANKSFSAGENTEESIKEFFGVNKITERKIGFIWGDCFNGVGMDEIGEWLQSNVVVN
ncbi:hypothetical protein SteCoe_31649 [Stentor coeruleus]|uniref:ADP-ribosylation factor n=1 Tax=Stentor coeruleus TaxID=5963 RepID=A0A1R2B0U1_9CILI|nr:hypothetical protein SteCoe_31649 [Stentor coeruleus]